MHGSSEEHHNLLHGSLFITILFLFLFISLNDKLYIEKFLWLSFKNQKSELTGTFFMEKFAKKIAFFAKFWKNPNRKGEGNTINISFNYKYHKAEYVQRRVCFVNVQSSLDACIGKTVYIIFILWTPGIISGLTSVVMWLSGEESLKKRFLLGQKGHWLVCLRENLKLGGLGFQFVNTEQLLWTQISRRYL